MCIFVVLCISSKRLVKTSGNCGSRNAMSIQQLEALWPKRPALNIEKLLAQKRRSYKRAAMRKRRQVAAFLRNQYYLTNAFADSRRAIALNEDIALASLFIIAVMSFSTISIFSNMLYTFVLAASILSTLSGVNLALLLFAACGVMGVISAWLSVLFQNSLSIALMEGVTRKQKRSLLLTLRKSLHHASRTASAWLGLLLAASIPAGLSMLTAAGLVLALHISMSASLPYLIAVAVLAVGWIVWVLANFTLLPYVVLFEKFGSWRDAAVRSRQLVRGKGRLWVISGYLAFACSLAVLYGVALLIQIPTHFNPTIAFLLMSTVAVSTANAVLTMFYRKRKLARK